MSETALTRPDYDLLIIGGGVNGCGIARDAAGRGLSVCLCEQGDLAQATSSSSTKLFHGGLRYLEYYEFSLVRKALIEREVLLRNMPHIAWPMRFVLPHHKGQRPAWMLRIGLLFYDYLAGRSLLPKTRRLHLNQDVAGKPLQDKFRIGFEYSDCWVDDARLVVLNALDAAQRGASIKTRSRVLGAERCSDSQQGEYWKVTVQSTDTNQISELTARVVVNAAGPWVANVIDNVTHTATSNRIRLVRGSHIVVPKLYDHERAYFLQHTDNRVIFTIPFARDYTLIGTTESEHHGSPDEAQCTLEEAEYLCEIVSGYFLVTLTVDDIVWRYAGVRPLYDDGAKSATAATRDYVLQLDTEGGPALLNIFGGKITTYRRLAEQAMMKLQSVLPDMQAVWTDSAPLPGGDFGVEKVDETIQSLLAEYTFLDNQWAERLITAYGTLAWEILGDAESIDQLGTDFGHTLTEREVDWLITHEWACNADDVLWRRSKLGLHFSAEQSGTLNSWIQSRRNAESA